MSKSVLNIVSSNLLDRLFSEEKFRNKTTLEKIEYLNKYRSRRALYGYNQSMMDNMIDDQPGRRITFNNVRYKGVPANPITLYWDSNINSHIIAYSVDAPSSSFLNELYSSVIPYAPNGNNIATRRIYDFLRHDARHTWSSNADYQNLLSTFRAQYEKAWLELKRKKVSELKATLDRDSVSEFVAAKRAEKTQAIMDIAMAVSSLTAKLETYRNRIGSVTNIREAEKMFDEVHNHFQNFTYVQGRNQKRLNPDVRIPGGARVKRLAETDES